MVLNGDRSRHQFDGIFVTGVMFSKDSDRFGYLGHREGKFYLVVDDVEYGPYDDVDVRRVVMNDQRGVRFSPTGKSFYIIVFENEKWSIVVNGKKGPEFDGIIGSSVVYSDDEEHFAYIASENKLLSSKYVVVKNHEGTKLLDGVTTNTPLFTSTGKLVYGSMQEKKWRVHVDDWISEPFESVFPPGIILSPDRSRVAFIGTRGSNKQVAVIDGNEEAQYEQVGIHSTTGDILPHYEYVFIGSNVITVNTASPKVTKSESSIIFSHDSQHYAYIARDGGKYKIIIDGVVAKAFAEDAVITKLEFKNISSSLVVVYKLKNADSEQVVQVDY